MRLKVGLSPSKKVNFICFNKSPLKMIKNVFLFHIKSSLLILKIFSFFPDFLVMQKMGLIRKLRLISEFKKSLDNI